MSEEQVEQEPGACCRRRVLAGAGLAGAAAVLGACGTDPANTYEVPSPPPPPTSPDPEGATGGGGYGESGDSDDDDNEDGSPPENALAATADVAVGGGLILADEGVVVTQPAAGEWRGFSSVCTHEGCTVSEVVDGTINCNCHGSKFSIQDGSVVTAAFGGDPGQQSPLPEVAVAVEGDTIVRA